MATVADDIYRTIPRWKVCSMGNYKTVFGFVILSIRLSLLSGSLCILFVFVLLLLRKW
jgi:hypothetical protein